MIVLLVALVVLAVLGAVAGIAVAQVRRRERDNQVVPGRATRAPTAWAGAHTPEARLHRRLRDAVRSLAALPGVDAVTGGEVERHVADLDDRLVAVAGLPADQRTQPLATLADQVAAVEEAVGAFATDGLDGTTDAAPALAALTERLDHLAAAHAELDALEQRPEPGAVAAEPPPSPAPEQARATPPTAAPPTAAPPTTSPPTEPPTPEQGHGRRPATG